MSPLLLLILLLTRCASTIIVKDRLLNNGDFETPAPGGFMSGRGGLGEVTATIVPILRWTVNGTVELMDSGVMMLIIPQGKHAVRLGNEAGIHQIVEVEKGATYSVTFSAARTCAQLEQLSVSSGSITSATVDLQTLYSVEGWDTYAHTFQAVEQNGQEMREESLEEAVWGFGFWCSNAPEVIVVAKFAPVFTAGEEVMRAKLDNSGEIEQRATSRQQRSIATSFFAAATENEAASFKVGGSGRTIAELNTSEESSRINGGIDSKHSDLDVLVRKVESTRVVKLRGVVPEEARVEANL